MDVTALVLAAGKGKRFGLRTQKLLSEINSQPVIIYSLKTLSRYPCIKNIIVVANNENKEEIARKINQYNIGKVTNIVKGGVRRQDSVFAGLEALDKNTGLVLIHDAARPFVDKKIIASAIKEAGKIGAAVAGVPVKATLKKVKSQKSKVKIVEKTLDRERIWEIQTPQVFKKDLILEAYSKFNKLDFTDDAGLVEKLGHKVSVVLGSYNNIKITTPEDLVLAQAIARNSRIKLQKSKIHIKI